MANAAKQRGRQEGGREERKPRSVRFTDGEWSALGEIAYAEGTETSVYLRQLGIAKIKAAAKKR